MSATQDGCRSSTVLRDRRANPVRIKCAVFSTVVKSIRCAHCPRALVKGVDTGQRSPRAAKKTATKRSEAPIRRLRHSPHRRRKDGRMSGSGKGERPAGSRAPCPLYGLRPIRSVPPIGFAYESGQLGVEADGVLVERRMANALIDR